MKKIVMTLERLPEFVRQVMGENKHTQKWGSGFAHIKRVRKLLDLLLAYCTLDERMIKMLKVSIWLHDIRRDKLSGHEAAAAEMFKLMEFEELTAAEREMICYTIMNHGRGPERLGSGEPAQPRDELLRYLILLDRIDCLYLNSVLKTIQWQVVVEKRMDPLSEIPARRLRKLLEKGEFVIEVDGRYLREESYLGRMISDYLTVKALVELMRPQLGEEFVGHIKMEETRTIIWWMLDQQEEYEKSFTEAVVF